MAKKEIQFKLVKDRQDGETHRLLDERTAHQPKSIMMKVMKKLHQLQTLSK